MYTYIKISSCTPYIHTILICGKKSALSFLEECSLEIHRLTTYFQWKLNMVGRQDALRGWDLVHLCARWMTWGQLFTFYRPFFPHKTGVITGSLHGGRACQWLHIMSDTWQYPESVSWSHNCSPLRHYHHMIQVWRPILGRSMICKVILNKSPSFHVYLSYLPKWRAYILPAFKNYLTQNITVGIV